MVSDNLSPEIRSVLNPDTIVLACDTNFVLYNVN